ncbi:hypothetical protein CAPTEDRAFT_223945 [Capitella teleta]|uniref:Fucolectin tachylectin-4 pentraxin-1 domain-containing protein n=1 Tax=Capitella teleta TaxID=283909 RepID=R7VHJ5_CAPTE|nr:hypothetical protein CAPTEDRAFT_223945 [Capitella teleta]|eukprot:ELU18308.1 hypothetical protein CAPTEDRAFT_223945 [Capitella teleta]
MWSHAKHDCKCVQDQKLFAGSARFSFRVNHPPWQKTGRHQRVMMHLIFVIHGITLVLQATSAAQLTNLAFEKPTKHKTEFNPPTWASDKAVDADPGGTTCTATGKDKPDPWWYVDLERYVYISNITLKNRISPYTSITSKLHDFDIYIGGCEIDTSDLSTWAFCTHYTGSASSGEVLNFSCDLDDVFGRYVLVNIPGATEMLTLCNVEVIGVYGCPPGWMQRYFACYKIESSPKTFALAQDSCSKRGAVLVVIDDETEFNFISTSVRATGSNPENVV